MPVMTDRLDDLASRATLGYYRNPLDQREAALQWMNTVKAVFDQEVNRVADAKVQERLAGPYTHKYKGVAVTEEQFWQFMKLEGFERPSQEIGQSGRT